MSCEVVQGVVVEAETDEVRFSKSIAAVSVSSKALLEEKQFS